MSKFNQSDQPWDPDSKTWIERFKKAYTMPPRFESAWKEADGIYMTNLEGKRFISFLASAHNLGYKHPAIMAAARTQMEATGMGRLRGVHPTLVLFAEKLKEVAPRSLKTGRLAICNTGSDAAEFCMQLSRGYTGRLNLLAHMGAHHGFGQGALALSADRSRYKQYCPPLMPGIIHVPYPNCFRCHFGQEYPNCDFLCIEHIHYTLATISHPKQTAAFFIEPISAQEIVVPPKEYLPMIKELCETHEILFVDDEALVGFGRTGKMWGIEHSGVEPNLMFMAKSIGNGMPMACVFATQTIMEKEEVMQTIHGGTFPGNLLAFACASALLDVLHNENLIEKAAELGNFMQRRFREFAEDHEIIGDVRGMGLFLGIELVMDSDNKRPATKEALQVRPEAYKRGLLLGITGTYSNIIRLLPPLIISKEEADTAVTIIEDVIQEVERH